MPFTNPFEMYKDDHYRVVHCEEEVAKLTKEGWSDERPENHKYLPWSAHPSQVALTMKRAEIAKVVAQSQAKTARHEDFDPGPRPEVVPPSVPMIGEEPAKRGPGRPPNQKSE